MFFFLRNWKNLKFSTVFLSFMPKMLQFIAESLQNRVKITQNALICHYFDIGDMKWRLFGMLKKLGDKSGDFGAKAWRHGL